MTSEFWTLTTGKLFGMTIAPEFLMQYNPAEKHAECLQLMTGVFAQADSVHENGATFNYKEYTL